MNDWLEMLAWLVASTIGSRAFPPRATLRATTRMASLIASTVSPPRTEDTEMSERAQSIASALSSHLPVSNCLDEAIAARLWLARRGVRVEVVVGMRRTTNGWDGHAWFEHDGTAHGAGELPHKIVFRESEVSR